MISLTWRPFHQHLKTSFLSITRIHLDHVLRDKDHNDLAQTKYYVIITEEEAKLRSMNQNDPIQSYFVSSFKSLKNWFIDRNVLAHAKEYFIITKEEIKIKSMNHIDPIQSDLVYLFKILTKWPMRSFNANLPWWIG